MPAQIVGVPGSSGTDNFDPHVGGALVDFVGGDTSSGGEFSARILASGGDIGALRTAAVLRENEWREYDKAVLQIARGKFSLVTDMMREGMRRKLTNPLATTQMVWDRLGDMDDAQIDMTGEANDIRDRLEFGQDSMPIPIIHKGFKLNIRHLLASRKFGTGLDVTHAEVATTKVVHTIEKLFLTGNFSAGTGAGRVYGLTTYPYRNAGSLSADWRSATATQIFNDVNAMVEALEAKAQFGPYGLYIPRNYAPVLRKDYDRTTSSGASIEKRLMEISNLKYIKTNIFLPDNHVIMLSLDSSTAEVLDGIQPRMIEWQTQGGMVFMFKVMAVILPRIKRDALDQNGIAHFTI
jgi:uncharacterized linocin/CFP29 family protein